HMDRLDAEFGRPRVLGGSAALAIAMLPDGRIKHLNDWQHIAFGEQDGRISERATALKSAFDKTTVVAAAVPDIRQKMWEKPVLPATIAGMTTSMRASIGEIARVPGGTALMLELFERNASSAEREGTTVSAYCFRLSIAYRKDSWRRTTRDAEA
ncbi:MAG: hypothetical protein ACREC6_14580, partial [Hyphomicrobiaceae bacterium]